MGERKLLLRFVARWYPNILQLHTRLQVELDHGRGGASSRADCPPSERSEAEVHRNSRRSPRYSIVLRAFAVIYSAVYHRKLGPRTIRLNLVTTRLLIYIVTQCLYLVCKVKELLLDNNYMVYVMNLVMLIRLQSVTMHCFSWYNTMCRIIYLSFLLCLIIINQKPIIDIKPHKHDKCK